jgi:hypothetical protein
LVLRVFVLVGCLAGCSTTRWVAVEPGEYGVVSVKREANQAAMREIHSMRVDREERVVVFALADGSEIVTAFVPRSRAEWPTGCPTNIYSHGMEVLDIEQQELIIGSVAYDNPILVRGCPPDPVRVVLREDGEIGGGGGACTGQALCIFFGPK